MYDQTSDVYFAMTCSVLLPIRMTRYSGGGCFFCSGTLTRPRLHFAVLFFTLVFCDYTKPTKLNCHPHCVVCNSSTRSGSAKSVPIELHCVHVNIRSPLYSCNERKETSRTHPDDHRSLVLVTTSYIVKLFYFIDLN